MSYQSSPEYNNILRYRLLTKPGGLTYKDICLLTGYGKTTSQKIIYAIQNKIASTPGALIPIKGRITRQAFCEYMGWDFNEIQRFAFAELSAMNHCRNNNTYNTEEFPNGNL